MKQGQVCLMVFEVETHYKSGRKRNEYVVSKNEESMWEWYDKHHDAELVESSFIVDVFPF